MNYKLPSHSKTSSLFFFFLFFSMDMTVFLSKFLSLVFISGCFLMVPTLSHSLLDKIYPNSYNLLFFLHVSLILSGREITFFRFAQFIQRKKKIIVNYRIHCIILLFYTCHVENSCPKILSLSRFFSFFTHRDGEREKSKP